MLPLQTLRILMKPLVRLFVRNARSVQDFNNLAKILFVECAEEELAKSGKRVSLSRLSALTGLNRRDVTSIARDGGTPVHSGASVLARVIGHWEGDRRFRDASGAPRGLSSRGENSEFSKLVSTVSRDIHLGTILSELCRAGIAEERDGLVYLLNREAIVPRDAERGFSLLSRDTDTLFEVVSENILAPQPIKNLHLRTEFDNIDQRKIPMLRQWLLEQGQEFHRRARGFFAEHDLDMSSGSEQDFSGGRVVLTTFGFAQEAESSTRISQSLAKRPPKRSRSGSKADN